MTLMFVVVNILILMVVIVKSLFLMIVIMNFMSGSVITTIKR